MHPVIHWTCPGCSLRVRFENDDGEEARRLLEIARDLHRPHCPGSRSQVGDP